MKRKILLAVLILAAATGCGKVPVLKNGEEAIISFKNEKLNISVDELFNEMKDKHALNILIDMMDMKILLDKYPDEKENAKDYIKEEVQGIKQNFVDDKGKYDEEALLNALNYNYGFTKIEELESLIELNYYRTKAIEDYAKDQIKEKEIEKYYKDEVVGDIEASHILIRPDVDEDMDDKEIKEAEKEAEKLAKKIIKKLDDGEDFAKLAKEYSADKANSNDGGKLGFFNKGEMTENFEKAAYALKVNAYSKKPVKTSFGYHIILKTDEKEKNSLEDSKENIIKKLASELQMTDNTLPINALADLRKDYGFNIEDSSIKKRYSTNLSNQLLNARAEK